MSTHNERRYAAIDIGTNTALLLIVGLDQDGNLAELVQEQRFPRLGQGLGKTGLIRDVNSAAALRFVEEYVRIAAQYQPEWIKIVGTAALREAENGHAFCHAVLESTGLTVEIISGDDEAWFSYLGAISNKSHLEGETLVVDIGGGSCEFILGKMDVFKKAVSLGIGSVKLTEAFGLESRVSSGVLEEARQFVFDHLLLNKEQISFRADHLVGTAGTYTTLAAIHAGMTEYESTRIDGSVLTLGQIDEIQQRLKNKNSAQRLEIPGIVRGREDVVLGGTIIAREILDWFGLSELIVSDRGLRFGVILATLKHI